jgi:deoxyribodipyrimidine photo-lyase
LPPLPPAEAIPPLRVEYAIPDDRENFLKCLLQPIDLQFQACTETNATSLHDAQEFSAGSFRGGESNGLERLFHLVESGAISSHEKAKKALMGHDRSTKLSAYLAIGCITARQIHEAMGFYEDGKTANTSRKEHQTLLERFRGTPGFGCGENEGTKSVRRMLLWRDYFHLLARKLGNQLFVLNGSREKHILPDREDKKQRQFKWRQITSSSNSPEKCEVRHIFKRFVVGRTGMSLIDASQRQLLFTGYISNRARQNVAYFLAKLMHIDWRLGAEWYECALVDYDPACNWGNWQYAAGVGNDPRQGRVFNAVKQAFDYDPKGEYIKEWVPEMRDLIVLDAQGDGAKQKLLKLYQPCNLNADEREAMRLKGADFVEDPLMKIEFSIRKKRRAQGEVRGGGRRGRGGGRGGRGGTDRRGTAKNNAAEMLNPRQRSDNESSGESDEGGKRERTRVAVSTAGGGEGPTNDTAQQQNGGSTGVLQTELAIRRMISRPVSAEF